MCGCGCGGQNRSCDLAKQHCELCFFLATYLLVVLVNDVFTKLDDVPNYRYSPCMVCGSVLRAPLAHVKAWQTRALDPRWSLRRFPYLRIVRPSQHGLSNLIAWWLLSMSMCDRMSKWVLLRRYERWRHAFQCASRCHCRARFRSEWTLSYFSFDLKVGGSVVCVCVCVLASTERVGNDVRKKNVKKTFSVFFSFPNEVPTHKLCYVV